MYVPRPPSRFHGASGRFCTLLTPMSRKTGMPSDSMNRSYGVFGRPNLPKPARLPAVGSCQWEPGTSCMAWSFSEWHASYSLAAGCANESIRNAADQFGGRTTEKAHRDLLSVRFGGARG